MKISASNLDSKVTSSAGYSKNSAIKTGVPSFSGKSQASMELARTLVSKTSRFPRILQWLGNNDGEIMNAIVTGIGTAFVAPIFIAFNPFSKEDKETKAYSAWRQPISAVIAAAIQIGINMKYNAHLDKIASTGHFDRADLSMYPTKEYLAKLIKHQHPEYTKKQLEVAVEDAQIEARWNAIDKARGNKKKGIEGTMRDRVFKPEELVDDDIKALAKEEVKREFKDEIDKLKGKAKEAFIDKKVKERAGAVAERVVEEKAKIKHTVREWISTAKQQDKTVRFVQIVSAKEQELIELLGKNESVTNWIAEAAKTNPKISLQQIIRQNSSELEELLKFCSPDEKLFIRTFKKLKGYKKFINVKDIGQSLPEILQSVKIKQYIYAQADKSLAVLKSYKKWTGIVISLITLPFSCGLLNYAYPRIMEKIMPNAAKKRKEKEAAAMQPPKKLDIVSTAKEVGK